MTSPHQQECHLHTPPHNSKQLTVTRSKFRQRIAKRYREATTPTRVTWLPLVRREPVPVERIPADPEQRMLRMVAKAAFIPRQRASPTAPLTPTRLRILEALTGTTTRLPQWVLYPAQARPVHHEPIPLSQLTASQAQACAVQVRHAIRVSAKLADLADWLRVQTPAHIRSVTTAQLLVEWVHTKVSRPSVHVPLATLNSVVFAVAHLVPDLESTAEMRSYRDGALTIAVTAPVSPPLDLPEQLVVECTIRALAKEATGSLLAAALLGVCLMQVQGMRLPESVRTLARGLQCESASVAKAPAGFTIREVTPFRLKDDKAALRVKPIARILVVRIIWWQRVQAIWGSALTRDPVTQDWLQDAATTLWHDAGIRDIRVLRKSAATQAWQLVTASVGSEAALEVVRRVLGHAAGSESTVRYVPDRVSHKDRVLDVAAAVARRV